MGSVTGVGPLADPGVGALSQAGGSAEVPQFAQNFAPPATSSPQLLQNFFGCPSVVPHSLQNLPPGCLVWHLPQHEKLVYPCRWLQPSASNLTH